MVRKRTSRCHTEPQQEKEREKEDDKPEYYPCRKRKGNRSCPRRSLPSTVSEGGSRHAPSSRRSKGKATVSASQPAPYTTTKEGGSQAATIQRKKRKTGSSRVEESI
ncbi:hypothetical protein LIER_36053 [Lithospermum erythrorhizon]|uniref:Uncharacterized protein n=1 Tax=Lithospermum erythrorhizon TaxID=34254 RepID=A0AAV3P0C7_LITER